MAPALGAQVSVFLAALIGHAQVRCCCVRPRGRVTIV